MSKTGLAAVLAVVVAGCVGASVERLSPTEYPAVPADSVTVFMTPAELQVDSIGYERIALVFTSGSAAFTSQKGHMRKAREEAGKLGANGVIIQSRDAGGEYNWFWGTESPEETQVMAIRWWIIPAAERKPR